MKSFCFMLCLTYWGLVIADVSHLSKQYIPPNIRNTPLDNQNSVVSTRIEKQELQELPVQVEYVEHGDSIYGIKPSSALTASPLPMLDIQPPPIEQQYLSPMSGDSLMGLPQMADIKTVDDTLLPSPETLAPVAEEVAVAMPPVMRTYLAPVAAMSKQQQQQRAQPVTQYLPPPSLEVMSAPSQPTYQQYQEELLRAQQLKSVAPVLEPQQMIELMPVAGTTIVEPTPAHTFSEDGYHYRNGNGNAIRRFRFRH